MGKPKRGYAAFAPGDMADAKRGRPETTLEAWAAARGLQFTAESGALPGQFTQVMPTWPDYVFNRCRGELVPGRLGYVAHELEEIGLDDTSSPRMQGPYFGLVARGNSRGLMSTLFSIDTKAVDQEPFDAPAIWVPRTQAAVRVPEAVLLPRIRIRTSDRFPLGGNPKLDDAGLPGFRIAGSDALTEDLRLAVGTAARPLAALGAPYAGLHIDRGLVAVFRNGFVIGDELDTLVAVASHISAAIGIVAAPLSTPQPFDVPLPPPDPSTWPLSQHRLERHEVEVFARVASELSMVQEDPVALHRAQPACPAPGRAIGAVRGVLPGTSTVGRVGFFDQGGRTAGSYRSVVMVPARVGATTPLGGQIDAPTKLYLEIADGITYAWPTSRARMALEAAPTIAAAIDAFRRLGLADL